MNRNRIRRSLVAGAALNSVFMLVGCSGYDDVSVHGSVGMYYGSGYYDPWYYGPGYGPPVVVVPPPSSRPRPEHPIARPPPPRPTPLPARPAPRPMPRRR